MAKVLGQHPSEIRYAVRWFCSILPGYNPLNNETPWITFRALDWLDSYLKPEMSIFEYGAGGSTLYFAKRVHNVVSVEHDRGFFEFVGSILAKRQMTNCHLILREPELNKNGDTAFMSYQKKYTGLNFEAYVRSIDEFQNQKFDLVMVDGRARVACVRQALPKIRIGGALLLDNSERPSYAEAGRILARYSREDMAGVSPWNKDVSQTSVWRISD